jgi:hypothetical protein
MLNVRDLSVKLFMRIRQAVNRATGKYIKKAEGCSQQLEWVRGVYGGSGVGRRQKDRQEGDKGIRARHIGVKLTGPEVHPSAVMRLKVH